MPNCDFYGTLEDHEVLLDWLLGEGHCQIHELASNVGDPLRQFATPGQVLAQFERTYPNGTKWRMVYLQLYVLGAGPPVVPRLVRLSPEHCGGENVRYVLDGWGLVQLYLGNTSSVGLLPSHTDHNTERRAIKWARSNSELGPVGAWDFDRITAFSARLNRRIRSLAVGKLNSRPILPGAMKALESGVTLLSNR